MKTTTFLRAALVGASLVVACGAQAQAIRNGSGNGNNSVGIGNGAFNGNFNGSGNNAGNNNGNNGNNSGNNTNSTTVGAQTVNSSPTSTSSVNAPSVSGASNTTTVSTRVKRQAPSIAAAGLAAAGVESCLGSTSIGGSGPGFGFSFGSTVQDRGCNIRLYSRTLFSMGYRQAATQMLCMDGDAATALGAQGIRCVVGPNATPVVRREVVKVAAGRSAAPAAPVCKSYDLFRGCRD